jgi:hypothetical protein
MNTLVGSPDLKIEDVNTEIRRLELAQCKRLENEPHRYYTPIGKFGEFIDQAMSGIHTTTLLEAANGIGKTYGMVNLLANLFWPVNNYYFQQPLFKEWNFPKKGRIVSYPNTVTETIIPALKSIFPKDRYNVAKYQTTKEGKRFEHTWKTDTGWEFTIMTTEQDVSEFESATLGWWWMDEPTSQVIYKANLARLRMGGVGFITETPLKGAQWIYDHFTNKTYEELTKERKAVVTAELEDACEDHGVRGFLTHKRIEEQISSYDAEDMQARVFGRHHHLTGLVFKKWDKRRPGIHIIPAFALDPKDYVVGYAWDTHPRMPEAILWIARDREGRWIMVDELWLDGSTPQVVQQVKMKNERYRIVKALIEPAAYNVDKRTGYCLAADLDAKYGLKFEPGSKSRESAVRQIQDKMDYVSNISGEIIKPPELFCFDTLEHTPHEIERWQWQDWRGLIAQFRDPKEKPVDKDDHMIECLGRLLLSDFKFEEMVEPVYAPIQRVKHNDDPYV